MEVILGIGFMLGLWVIVIWGASIFNQNVK